MSFSKSSVAAHRAYSTIYLMVILSKIFLYRLMSLNIDQITVYQSLFINKANFNRGSRNGMTCTLFRYENIRSVHFNRDASKVAVFCYPNLAR